MSMQPCCVESFTRKSIRERFVPAPLGAVHQCEHCRRRYEMSMRWAQIPALHLDPGDCDCRNSACGHKATRHIGDGGACIEPGCKCGPGGWT